jgi:hypothetical protein
MVGLLIDGLRKKDGLREKQALLGRAG